MLRPAALLLPLLLAGCPRSGPSTPDGGRYSEERQPCADHDPLRRPLFGDLHVHTALSFDAWTYDVRTTPADAYRFARGGTVHLPPLDGAGRPTLPVKLARPLDFAAVTDHAEYLGEVSLCTTPGSAVFDTETCRRYRGPERNFINFGAGLLNPERAAMCGPGGQACLEAAAPVWRQVQEAAEGAYDRTAACGFTTFVAYEYSFTPLGANLHRNVIFRNRIVPAAPITTHDTAEPSELWRLLRDRCSALGNGCDVLAIPHNSNVANGRLFAVEYGDAVTLEEQRAVAQLRAEIEPLVEITQHKGDSECQNGFARALGAPDELCTLEKLHAPPLRECPPGGKGFGGFLLTGCVSPLDFVRNVLATGLAEEARLGVNPFRLGLVASTDSHNGLAGHVEERGFAGHLGTTDNTPRQQLTAQGLAAKPLISNPGGLVGVWAEENSRDAIFNALRRRETFGTSGPRIVVRFFGGWSFGDGLCGDPELPRRGYDGGVPMGDLLPRRPQGAAAPRFVVAAMRDPGTAEQPGNLLQRLQIIKGWLGDDGQLHEQIFDVAGDPKNGATVDTATCKPSGRGADTLCAVWRDPAFVATQRAFYYARVVENPSCRWSSWVCSGLAPAQRAELGCDSLGVPKTIQERAWSSPIWYSP